jgi:hypothetical protein
LTFSLLVPLGERLFGEKFALGDGDRLIPDSDGGNGAPVADTAFK